VAFAATQPETITTLPWWMGVFILAIWLAAVGGAITIIRRRFRGRRAEAQARMASMDLELPAPTEGGLELGRGLGPELAGPRLELPPASSDPSGRGPQYLRSPD